MRRFGKTVIDRSGTQGKINIGRVPLPVGRAGFKPVGGRAGVLGRFDSCLFRHYSQAIFA